MFILFLILIGVETIYKNIHKTYSHDLKLKKVESQIKWLAF